MRKIEGKREGNGADWVPVVSAFIVNYKTKGLLERCVESIYRSARDVSIEIFVADNNSCDGSVEMLQDRFPDVHVTRMLDNLGYTRAMSMLMQKPRGRYFLLLHPDVVLLDDTVKKFLDFFSRNPKAGILGANLCYPDGTPNPCEILWPSFGHAFLFLGVRLMRRVFFFQNRFGEHNPTEWSHKKTCSVKSVWNACMMVRKEVYEELGGLDERFFYCCTDWDLCKRAVESGWKVYYIFDAKAIHYERQSFKKGERIKKEVAYKIDGWQSASLQYKDRCAFLRKHYCRLGVFGTKSVYFVENYLQFLWVLVRLLFGKRNRGALRERLRCCCAILSSIVNG